MTEETSLEQVFALLRRKLVDLRHGWVPLKDLLVKQKLSRELNEYRVPSPSARAAFQLQAVGKTLRAGQSVRFLYTRGEPGVHAWDLPQPLERAALDLDYYKELLLRAAESVLEPFGYDRTRLEERLYGYSQTVASEFFSSGGAGVYSLDAFTVQDNESNFVPGGEAGGDYLALQNVNTVTSI